jgi:hypothetical protein
MTKSQRQLLRLLLLFLGLPFLDLRRTGRANWLFLFRVVLGCSWGCSHRWERPSRRTGLRSSWRGVRRPLGRGMVRWCVSRCLLVVCTPHAIAPL